MCGRFALGIPSRRFMEFFNIASIEEREEYFRYNVAPTNTIPGIVWKAGATERQVMWLRWGLVPFWAGDPKIGSRMINARAETISEKPSFRQAFRERRCLVPAQGYYEWERREKDRIPWFIQRRDGNPMAFAGVWEHWKHGNDEITSCAIVTTSANLTVRPLHDRMPVILDPPAWDIWLDPASDTATLTSLFSTLPPDIISRYRVSHAVNSVKHDGPDCIIPVAD